MAHYFGVAAHAHCSAAKLIFDAAIDALDRGALIVADLLSGSVAEPLAAFFLGFELLLSAGPCSRVDIDDGNVAERATVLPDLRGVVSAVHDIIQISRPGRRHAGQWDRRLAIVKRGGGEQAADRNTTVGNVEVQLVADPALLLAPRFREGRLLRGRPGLYFAVSGAAGFTGFSRASIAVLSREICPTSRSLWVCAISASCTFEGSALAANSAKARENVASLGISFARSQPHSRRKILSGFTCSISIVVVVRLKTALATKARASAGRSAGGRPTAPWPCRKKASIRAISSIFTRSWCMAPSAPTRSSNHGKRSC